jgi:hypothetical protein
MTMFALQVILSLEDEHTSFSKSKINGLLTFMNKLNYVETQFPKF